jgi:hypothetical protein
MRRIRFSVLAIVWILIANSAWGAELSQFAGTWDMHIGHRNLFILNLRLEGNTVQGTLDRPTELSSEHNLIFANMRGGLRHDPVVKSQLVNGALHLTIRNANDQKDEDDYIMTVNGDSAELADDDPIPADIPLHFERATPAASVATDWEPNQTYSVTDPDADTSSPEMKSIYDEDQRVRVTQPINWAVVNQTDAQRRELTRKLLANGALHTGKDFEEASFIFQHGTTADDYLLAHTLAIVAVSKGDPTAIWIAAATLDRYLQIMSQKQIYGTQFKGNPSKTDPKHLDWSQEPYSRDLVSDPLREALGIPPIAKQALVVKALQSQK